MIANYAKLASRNAARSLPESGQFQAVSHNSSFVIFV
jgi:hypothetical protein